MTCNLTNTLRNFDLRDPGDRLFSDLDNGQDELVDLGVDGSGCLMHLFVTYYINPEVTDYYVCGFVALWFSIFECSTHVRYGVLMRSCV